jgi:hypothetical protein
MKTLALSVAAFIGVFSAHVFAQETAAASALFERGLAAMEAGRYDEGCPALEESYRIEPLAGVLFTSAECHAKWGKTATAVARYQDYLNAFERMPASQRVKQRGRDDVAKKQIAALEPKVPKLSVSLPPDAPPQTVVKRGGVVLGRPSLGVPIPVDPGEHIFTTEVPGGSPHEQRISVQPGETKSVVLEIEQAGGPEAKPRAHAAAGAASASSAPEPGGSSQRTLGYVIGGIGVAGVIAGSVTGALVFSKKSTVDDNCQDTLCNAEGKDAADSAKTLGLVSNIAFGVGAAGLLTGAVLILTAPKAETVGQSARSAAAAYETVGQSARSAAAAHATVWRPVLAGGARSAYVGVSGDF